MSLADQANETYVPLVVCANLTLAMVGIDNLLGGRGDDYLKGDEGNNILAGGPGDDVLIGGEGNDTVDYSTNAYYYVACRPCAWDGHQRREWHGYHLWY